MKHETQSETTHYGVVCAVDEEYEMLIQKLSSRKSSYLGDKNITAGKYEDAKVVVIQSGIGNINSAMATTLLIAHYNPAVMLFSGIAGALDLTLKEGDVVVGKSAFQAEAMSHEQLRVTWDMPKLDKLASSALLSAAESLYSKCEYNIKTGVIVSSDIYPAPKDYQDLIKQKNADAIDMETAAFYQTCNSLNKPCLCIRSFSNTVTNSDKEVLEKELIAISSTNSSAFCFDLIKHLNVRSALVFPGVTAP